VCVCERESVCCVVCVRERERERERKRERERELRCVFVWVVGRREIELNLLHAVGSDSGYEGLANRLLACSVRDKLYALKQPAHSFS
jgi:hypothetical protein